MGDERTPVRGALDVTAAASSPQTVAGADFSIFVRVQNPFEVPIALYLVETHVPVELLDMNTAHIAYERQTKRWREEAMRAEQNRPRGAVGRLWDGFINRFEPGIIRRIARDTQTGLAQARYTNGPVQTEYVQAEGYDPERGRYDSGYYRTFVTLEPGDAVVQQFVFRTRATYFFTPLTHTFQIQVTYGIDGVDHSQTVPFELSITASLRAIIAGGLVGALMGAGLRTLTSTNDAAGTAGFIQAAAIALLAATAVVIAFARKTSAQPFISIEDFWGGVLIGFSVGFLGYEQFSDLFTPGSGSDS